MRSFYSREKFFQKMKKKPELQAVIDSIDNYSEDDIEKLEGTHFPIWIKEQLQKLRGRSGRSSEDIAQEIAEKMIAASRIDK